MPTAFIHEDPASWGADAADFRPDRFLKTKSTREEQTKRATAFRPFGGGNTLCPGRHFAFNEIITFVGTMVMGFDLAPIGGIWKLPEKDRSRMPMSSLKPATDIGLVVSRRKGFEDVRFR
jgi:cytochrome P450